MFLTSLELAGGCVQTGASNLLQLVYTGAIPWGWGHLELGSQWLRRCEGSAFIPAAQTKGSPGNLGAVDLPTPETGSSGPVHWAKQRWAPVRCAERAHLEAATETVFPQLFPGTAAPG